MGAALSSLSATKCTKETKKDKRASRALMIVIAETMISILDPLLERKLFGPQSRVDSELPEPEQSCEMPRGPEHEMIKLHQKSHRGSTLYRSVCLFSSYLAKGESHVYQCNYGTASAHPSIPAVRRYPPINQLGVELCLFTTSELNGFGLDQLVDECGQYRLSPSVLISAAQTPGHHKTYQQHEECHDAADVRLMQVKKYGISNRVLKKYVFRV